MLDYEQTVKKLIDSVVNFYFEFDVELLRKEMELQEVPMEELTKLGEIKVKESFNKGIFKIKLPDGRYIDSTSIYLYRKENNIKEPVIFVNPNFKYVQWIVKKDFINPQIKKQIRSQLTDSNDIVLTEVQKNLFIEDFKSKKIEGYLDELPIMVSNFVKEGKFHIHCSCSRESAIQMINDEIELLAKEAKVYVVSKIRRDYLYILFYVVFVVAVSLLWFVNQDSHKLPKWLSSLVALVLFLVPLVVMRLINHSIFDTLFFRKKAEKKYKKEFNTQIV